jgi:hypothetical protein
MRFMHDMAFVVPVSGLITLTWAILCRYLWRQGKPVEEP